MAKPKADRDMVGQVHDALMAAIVEHRLPPGTKLSEDEVGEAFGCSRTIVNSALRRLAYDRLVELRRNRGAFVAHPTIAEAREVFEARELVEPRTARSAAERATDADIEDLRRHILAEHEALEMGQRGRAISLSGEFHNAIARIARQETLEAFIRSLISRSSLIVALYWRRADATCERHAHGELLRALASHDGRRAEELMRSHLVDILSGLDLVERKHGTVDIAKALARSA